MDFSTSHSGSNELLLFIPARGGSKGIIDKNLSLIDGHPLVARSILVCQEFAQRFSENCQIVVSSDSEKILKVAQDYGAISFRRSAALSRDSSTTEDALLEYLDNFGGSDSIEYVALLQCTSPFTRVTEIHDGFKAVRFEGFDSAFIGVENHYWLYREELDSWIPDGHSLGNRPSRQQVAPRAHETGAAYFFSKTGFVENKFRIFGRTQLVRGDHFSSVDIDELSDLDFARKIVSQFE